MATKKQLESSLRLAICILASTVFTHDRVLTLKQKSARRRLLKQASRLLPVR